MNHIGRGSRIRTYEVTESESVALPLGDTPKYILLSVTDCRKTVGRGGRIRTCECESQSLVPYRLATPLKISGVSKEIRTLGLQSHNLAL